MAILSLVDLTVHYGRLPADALRGISIEIDQGEAVLIVGPNGAGKSTTMLAISGSLPCGRVKSASTGDSLLGRDRRRSAA